MENTQSRKRFDYKWVVFALAFATIFTALGMFSGNRSLYLSPITTALGISRGAYSVTDTCRYVATTILNLFFGTLILKFGVKKMMGAGFIACISSLLLYSFATTADNTKNLIMIYAAGFLFGVGMAWTTTNVVSYIIGQWFKENKGTIMGIVLAANGLGTAITSLIIEPMIDAETYGYANAFRTTAICIAAVGVVVMIFMKPKPDGAELVAPPAGKKRPSRGSTWKGIPFSEVAKKPYFYFAGILLALTGFTLQGVHGTTAPYYKDLQIEATFIALSLSAHSICLTIAKIVSGISFDRFGLRITMLIMYSISIVGTFMLTFITSESRILAIVADALFSFAMPLETIMLPLIALGLFGDEPFAKTMGYFSAFCTAGFAFASPITNAIFDKIGTYRPIYYAMTALLIVIAVAFQIILSVNEKERKTIYAEQ